MIEAIKGKGLVVDAQGGTLVVLGAVSYREGYGVYYCAGGSWPQEIVQGVIDKVTAIDNEVISVLESVLGAPNEKLEEGLLWKRRARRSFIGKKKRR